MSTTTPGDTTAVPQATTERCGQCGAPAAREQRYCVNCGFHRRNAPDPVSRYLSEASAARARVAAATALAARRGRGPRIGVRAAALLAVLALLIGVLIGNALGRAPTSGGTPGRTTTGAVRPSTRVKLGTATGSRYLQQEQNLPNSVTP